MARRGKKSSGRRRHVKHAGVMGGIAGTAFNLIFGGDAVPGQLGSVAAQLVGPAPGRSIETRLELAGKSFMVKAKNPANYIPLGAGIAATASTKIPIVKIAARPLSDAIANMTGQRWRL